MTATTRRPGDVRPWLAACLVFVVFLALYLLTLSNHYSADAMAFATMTTKGPTGSNLFFQAEHLLYPAVPWLWYQTWGLFGYPDGALRPLQALNAISAAAGVTLLSLAFRIILEGRVAATSLSILGALALGVSYGYWYHGTEAEDQIISIAFVIASLLILVMMSRDGANVRNSTALVLTTSLAVLFHATAVLIFPALLLAIERWRYRLGLLAGVGLVLSLSYSVIGIALLGFRSPADFLGWVSSAPAKGVWGHLQLSNLTEAARTFSNAVLYSGGFPNLIGISEGAPLAPASRFIIAALLAGAFFLVVYGIYRWRGDPHDKWTKVMLTWLATVVLFNLYWASGDIQFWIAAVIPMAALAAIVSADLISRFPRGPAFLGLRVLAVTVLFFGNLFGAIVPRNDLATNEGYAETMCLRDKTGTADLIVTPGWDWASSYLPYFAHREVLSLVDAYLLEAQGNSKRFPSVLQKRLSDVWNRGAKVFAVRLFPMEEKERAWFIESAGFDPGGFGLKGQPAGDCLSHLFWEIQP